MASSTPDDGFHEIQLNGKQLVFLFMAVTVVSVVIFLCGVLVGRGVRLDRGADDPLLSQEAFAPAPGPSSMSAPANGGTPATANETLSYADRLGKAEPPREQLREAPAAPPIESAPPHAATSPPGVAPSPADRPADSAGPGFAIQLAALAKREDADAIARRLTGKGYPAYVVSPDAGAPAVFRVRVGKFADRREAESVAARLQKEEQFNPWIVR